MTTGAWGTKEGYGVDLDHINGDKTDNRFINIRANLESKYAWRRAKRRAKHVVTPPGWHEPGGAYWTAVYFIVVLVVVLSTGIF